MSSNCAKAAEAVKNTVSRFAPPGPLRHKSVDRVGEENVGAEYDQGDIRGVK